MKWEYDKRYDMDITDLDKMGREGWELVSVVYRQNYHEEHLYVLKREIPEPLTMAPIGCQRPAEIT